MFITLLEPECKYGASTRGDHGSKSVMVVIAVDLKKRYDLVSYCRSGSEFSSPQENLEKIYIQKIKNIVKY